MVKLVEKIKNIFSGKFVYKPKCCSKKEEPQPKADQPLADKAEEKPEEQKQQPSTEDAEGLYIDGRTSKMKEVRDGIFRICIFIGD